MAKNKLPETTLKVGSFLEEFEKDSIKDQVDIVSLFSNYGVKLKKKGSSYVACCPWHDDKTPSLSVDKIKGLYNCFGCGESGDVFNLVMKMENVDFPQSISILKEKHIVACLNVQTQQSSKPLEHARARTQDKCPDVGTQKSSTPGNSKEVLIASKPEDKKGSLGDNVPQMSLDVSKMSHSKDDEVPITDEEVEKLLEDANKFEPEIDSLLRLVRDRFFMELQSNKKAKEYLKKRNIHDNSIIKRYTLGYSSGNLTETINKDTKRVFQEIGLLNEKGNEFFKDCIIFPLTDQYHNVVGFYGRDTNDKSKFKHRYLKGEHKGLFNIEAVKIHSDEIILTESVIDGISLQKLGFNNTLPCYGVNGFSDPHLKALKDNLVKRVVIAFDGDESGITGSKKLKEKLFNEGFHVKEITPPKGNDWNEYLLSKGTKEEIEELLKTVTYEGKDKKPFEVESKDSKHVYTFGEMVYRVSGVKDSFISNLKVNIKAETNGKNYIDNVDLYSARSRTGFIGRLASTLDLNSPKVEKQILSIIEHLEELRDKALIDEDETKEVVLTEEDKKLGLAFLKNPKMFDEIVKDTETLGYVGESINKQLIYLAASSRLLDDPISVTVISESASGKSYLIDTVKKLIPEEDVLSITTLSDQALNYLPEDALLHKFMVMGEAVHSDVIDHQIREMLSSKELSRLVTTKDEKTGKMVSKTVRKDVVVSTVMSSTNTDINPENASRVFVINTDESVEQTKRIHSKQREKYSLNRYKSKVEDIPEIIHKHKCAQRMLRKLLIVNDFVEHLTFPDSLMRTRRDHERFIDLISTICFLRQYQKKVQTEIIDKVKVEYIICDMEDYKIAREIMESILSATLMNIPKSALVLYDHFRELVKKLAEKQSVEPEEVILSQRDIREFTGLSQMIVKRNIKVLVDYEYIKKFGGVSGQKNTYKLYKDESIEMIASNIPSVKEIVKLMNNTVTDKKRGSGA